MNVVAWRWRLLSLIACLLVLWTAWTTLALPHLRPTEGVAHVLQGILVRVVLWVVPCSVYLWLQHRSLGWRRLAWLPTTASQWAFAFGTIAAASLAVSLDVARKLGVSPGTVWSLLLRGSTFGIPISEFLEELVFRGVILAELLGLLLTEQQARGAASLRAGFWMANLVASLVFMGLHWPWWIYTEGITLTLLLRSLGVFFLSLVLGVLFVRCRSLWPCVALHWLNNALAALAAY